MSNHARLSTEVILNIVFGILTIAIGILAIWATARYRSRNHGSHRRNVHFHHNRIFPLLFVQNFHRDLEEGRSGRILPIEEPADLELELQSQYGHSFTGTSHESVQVAAFQEV